MKIIWDSILRELLILFLMVSDESISAVQLDKQFVCAYKIICSLSTLIFNAAIQGVNTRQMSLIDVMRFFEEIIVNLTYGLPERWIGSYDALKSQDTFGFFLMHRVIQQKFLRFYF